MLLPLIIPGELPDRRRRPRLKLSYSVRLRRPGVDSLIETKTEDVSCEGFLCLTDCIFHPKEILGCELVIPGEREGVASDHDIVLSCRAEVVRVESHVDKLAFRVAFRVADYTIGHPIEEEKIPKSTIGRQLAYVGNL